MRMQRCESYDIQRIHISNSNFWLSDWDKDNVLADSNDKFDVLVSNPPYIDYNEKIDEKVKNNEPHLALYAKDNGLYFYEEIL